MFWYCFACSERFIEFYENRLFVLWHHFTSTTRILQGFAFFCKLGLFLFTVKLTKPGTTEIFMKCYCVARNYPITREITKPQTATVISLWFWILLAHRELYCNWPVDNQHSWNFSGVHGFLSLTLNLNVITKFRYERETKRILVVVVKWRHRANDLLHKYRNKLRLCPSV